MSISTPSGSPFVVTLPITVGAIAIFIRLVEARNRKSVFNQFDESATGTGFVDSGWVRSWIDARYPTPTLASKSNLAAASPSASTLTPVWASVGRLRIAAVFVSIVHPSATSPGAYSPTSADSKELVTMTTGEEFDPE